MVGSSWIDIFRQLDYLQYHFFFKIDFLFMRNEIPFLERFTHKFNLFIFAIHSS